MMRHSNKLILSLAGLAIATPVECKSEKPKEKKGNLIRPSQLPLYENPEDLYSFEYIGKEKSKLEEGVSVARKEFQSAYEATSDIRSTTQHYYQTGLAHTCTTWRYVLEEDNVSAKIGAISAGGLLALLIGGRKKGIIKMLFYTSLGATGVASLVYPKESKKIIRDLSNNAGDYSVIAYNFITGVKPQGESQTSSSQESQKPKNIPPKTSSTEVSTNIGNENFFQNLARQSSDITLWGFRLFDRSDVSSSSMGMNNENGVSDYPLPRSLRTILSDKSSSHKQDESTQVFEITETKVLKASPSSETLTKVSEASPIRGEVTKVPEASTSETLSKTFEVTLTTETFTKNSEASIPSETQGRALETPPTSETLTKISEKSPSSETINFDSYHSPPNQIKDTGQKTYIKEQDDKPSFNGSDREEYIDELSDVLIDSVLNMRIFGVQEEESDSKSALVKSDSESDQSRAPNRSAENSPLQSNADIDPFYNLSDAFIDSMLNLKIIPIEEGKEEEEEEEEKKENVDLPQSNSTTDSPTSKFIDESQWSTNDTTSTTTNNDSSKLWYEKLKYIFKRSKAEDTEKDISEMDKKFDQEDKEEYDLKETLDTQSVEENLESELNDGFSYVPKSSSIGNLPPEHDQNLSKTPVTPPAPKENNKDIIVNVSKTQSSKEIPPIKGDIGQSNPEDKDMYTTRS